jgi:DNA-directed RNA polymerase subunit L
MSAKLYHFHEEDDTLTFTLTNVDVCYANAIRRIILSEIPIIVIDKVNIINNTSRLNNEIIKQRLQSIPVCIEDLNIQYKNYLVELDVENNTDLPLIVTSKDFKIKNLLTNTYLDDSDINKIFPPYIPPTGKGEYYIDFIKLRPKLSEQLPGEKIKINAELDISNAKHDSMFNVVGTCSYGFTPDDEEIQKQLQIRKQQWKDEGKNDNDIDFEAKNWVLLEGLRYVKKNSFDFIVQTIGIYENVDIIKKACSILNEKLKELNNSIREDKLTINESINTMNNCYDIILDNEDYTIGNMLNYELYELFYKQNKLLNYVGFKKLHPHDTFSIIRLAFIQENGSKTNVKELLVTSIESSIQTIHSIKGLFNGTRK